MIDHPACVKNYGPWPGRQTWALNLCRQPGQNMDYEIQIFEDFMKWLEGIFKLRIDIFSIEEYTWPKDSPDAMREKQKRRSKRVNSMAGEQYGKKSIPAKPTQVDNPVDGKPSESDINVVRTMISEGKAGRRIFTLEGGQLGTSYAQTQIGDIVCRLEGCSKPVILLQVIGSSQEVGGYRVVGEAFVAFSQRDSDQFRKAFERDSAVQPMALGRMQTFYLN